MAQIYTHLRTRCFAHPHRETEERCARCGRPFCAECLRPGERAADGTRGWYCAACAAAIAAAAAAAAESRTARGRLRRLVETSKIVLPSVVAAGVLVGLAAFALNALRPRPERESTCGELTRIRSVGAIGLPGPSEALNVLTYPHRAEVRIQPLPLLQAPAAGSGAGAAGQEVAAGEAADGSALVDECDTGWRSAAATRLPVTVTIAINRDAWIQRVALWQDPNAPRDIWVRDVEVLFSPSESGDDFKPLPLDRPTQLTPSVEQQWFQVVQAPPPGGVSPLLLPPQERERYAQSFPDVVLVRRLQLRIRSTYGEGGPGSAAAGVALGEVALYGPDLEISVEDEITGEGARTGNYFFRPREIRALAGRPVFVMVLNRSLDAHTFVTAAQDRNMSLQVESRAVASGAFVAASRPGLFEFSCRLPGHAGRGLVGSIIVR